MKARILAAFVAALAWAASGCSPDAAAGRGFRMPAGNADKGKAAFIQLQCHTCHRVDGVELPPPTARGELVLTLGGEVTRRRTYGELVTAIIHPTRDISPKLNFEEARRLMRSPMANVNEQMTVAQLVDIATFLETHYREIVPLYPHDRF